jgi:hypothetical protein
MGHNLPAALDPDMLREQLALDHSELIDRAQDLLAGVDRFVENHSEINDDDVNGRAGDFVKQITTHAKAVDQAREAAKRPYNVAGDTVQAFFKKGMLDNLMVGADRVRKAMTSYAVRKEEAARRAAAEEAQRKANEARAAEAEARRLAQIAADEEAARRAADAPAPAPAVAEAAHEAVGKQLDVAASAYNDAERAQERALAKPAELSRTRGDLGSVSSLRAEWKFEVEDVSKVPVGFIQVNEAMVKAHMKSNRDANGIPQAVPGIRFFETKKIAIR